MEEGYVKDLVQFKHLTIPQALMFLKRIKDRQDIDQKNQELARQQKKQEQNTIRTIHVRTD